MYFFKGHASCLGQSQLWLHLFLHKIFYNSWKCSGKHFPVFVRLYNENISVVKYFYIRKLYYNETNKAYIYRSFNRVWALEIMTREVFFILLLLCWKHTPKEFWAMTLPPTTFIGRGGTVWTRAHWREEMFLWHHQWC